MIVEAENFSYNLENNLWPVKLFRIVGEMLLQTRIWRSLADTSVGWSMDFLGYRTGTQSILD